MAMDQNMVRGTACLALRTSSLMCTAPSKPVKDISLPMFEYSYIFELTNKSPRWSKQAKVPTDEAVVPPRSGSSVKKDETRAVPRGQRNQYDNEDDEEQHMKDTSH